MKSKSSFPLYLLGLVTMAFAIGANAQTIRPVTSVNEADKPSCIMTPMAGDQVRVKIVKTGLVYRRSLGQKLPLDAVLYEGTGRRGDDVTASCKDNTALCGAAQWFGRESRGEENLGKAWVEDADIAKLGVKFTYIPAEQAVEGVFQLQPGQKKFAMHFSGVTLDKQIVAGYQPQRGTGCTVEKDGLGNPNLTLVKQ
ncbi:MAG: hypothetical protein ABI747_03990 [Candidatus Moraniibacteriota bacterium]